MQQTMLKSFERIGLHNERIDIILKHNHLGQLVERHVLVGYSHAHCTSCSASPQKLFRRTASYRNVACLLGQALRSSHLCGGYCMYLQYKGFIAMHWRRLVALMHQVVGQPGVSRCTAAASPLAKSGMRLCSKSCTTGEISK